MENPIMKLGQSAWRRLYSLFLLMSLLLMSCLACSLKALANDNAFQSNSVQQNSITTDLLPGAPELGTASNTSAERNFQMRVRLESDKWANRSSAIIGTNRPYRYRWGTALGNRTVGGMVARLCWNGTVPLSQDEMEKDSLDYFAFQTSLASRSMFTGNSGLESVFAQLGATRGRALLALTMKAQGGFIITPLFIDGDQQFVTALKNVIESFPVKSPTYPLCGDHARLALAVSVDVSQGLIDQRYLDLEVLNSLPAEVQQGAYPLLFNRPVLWDPTPSASNRLLKSAL
jgi:hypothetical protein